MRPFVHRFVLALAVAAVQAQAGEALHPLAAAILENNQEAAVAIIRAGIPPEFQIDRSAMLDRLPSRRWMRTVSDDTPDYPVAIAAASLGECRVLEALARYAPQALNASDADHRNGLHYAAQGGFVACIDVLLRHDLDPLQAPLSAPISATPLALAVQAGHAEAVRRLLAAIPKSQYGAVPITQLVWISTYPQLQDKPELLQALLDAGVPPNYIAPQGGTALINAIENRNPAQVRLLIEHGAKTDTHRYRDRTAHEWAAYYNEGYYQSAIGQDIQAMVQRLSPEASDWHKDKKTEEVERLYRLIETPERQ